MASFITSCSHNRHDDVNNNNIQNRQLENINNNNTDQQLLDDLIPVTSYKF